VEFLFMALLSSEKQEIIKKYKLSPKDTGSVEVQVALLTEDINKLTEHLKKAKKDIHSKRGLMRKVYQRTSLLRYLKKTDVKRYQTLIKNLNLREKKL